MILTLRAPAAPGRRGAGASLQRRAARWCGNLPLIQSVAVRNHPGEFLRRARQRKAAREHLRAALDLFEQVGAQRIQASPTPPGLGQCVVRVHLGRAWDSPSVESSDVPVLHATTGAGGGRRRIELRAPRRGIRVVFGSSRPSDACGPPSPPRRVPELASCPHIAGSSDAHRNVGVPHDDGALRSREVPPSLVRRPNSWSNSGI